MTENTSIDRHMRDVTAGTYNSALSTQRIHLHDPIDSRQFRFPEILISRNQVPLVLSHSLSLYSSIKISFDHNSQTSFVLAHKNQSVTFFVKLYVRKYFTVRSSREKSVTTSLILRTSTERYTEKVFSEFSAAAFKTSRWTLCSYRFYAGVKESCTVMRVSVCLTTLSWVLQNRLNDLS